MTSETELTKFTAELPFALDDFQQKSCAALERGHGVLVHAGPDGRFTFEVGTDQVPETANDDKLRAELEKIIAGGATAVGPQRWRERPRIYKAAIWIAYGIVRLGMRWLGYGGNEWFRGPSLLPKSRAARMQRPTREDE